MESLGLAKVLLGNLRIINRDIDGTPLKLKAFSSKAVGLLVEDTGTIMEQAFVP